ncbi:MAG: hypothetical protein HLUCCA04_02675 [Oceanicaulis sp. HLUCCA04]|nr:MAG: hypothetical protein HLUCCA04_02675 [Oceanicaulis sp. HLUCCA04]
MIGMVSRRAAGFLRGAGAALVCMAGLAACATTPPSSSHMPQGGVTMPPPGLLDLCRRSPDVCDQVHGAEPVFAFASLEGAEPSLVVEADAEATGANPPETPIFAETAKMGVPQMDLLDLDMGEEEALAAIEEGEPDGKPAGTSGEDAAPSPSMALPLAADPELFALLNRVNQSINQSIRPRDDIDQYGVEEFWTLPLTRAVDGQASSAQGDCEDYALEKRRALVAAGVPPEALFLAVGHSVATGRHAVLMVRTDQGDYVLDNMTPYILPWAQTGYVWLSRQSPGNMLSWQNMAGLVS